MKLRFGRILGVAALLVPLILSVQVAVAEPCPDIGVVFARGTYEPAGVGLTGQAFVDAIHARADQRSVEVYPVAYEAGGNFGDGIEFAKTVVDGIRDAANRIQATVASCPNTRIVLGGYSQGAVVAGFVTSAAVPDSIPAEYTQYIPDPMSPDTADHVAAVVLMGKPSDQFMLGIGAPPIVIGPRYVDKTIELCTPGDTICDGSPPGAPNIAHGLYAVNGMADEGAAFAIDRL
ncbi:MAG: cutinase family protein [Mycobacterium sp.]